MNKTVKNKKYKRLFKTKKYYGGDNAVQEAIQNTKDEQKLTSEIGSEESQTSSNITNLINDINNSRKNVDLEDNGILDVVNDKVSDITENATDFLKEKALRLVGLQTIDNQNNDDTDNETNDYRDNQVSNEVSNTLSNVVNKGTGVFSAVTNNIVNDLDKAAAATVTDLNEVLQTPEVQQNLSQATQQTLQIGKQLIGKLNDSLSDPKTKKETAELLDNVAEYSQVAMDVLDEPINQAVDKLNEVVTNAASGVAAGAVKVAADAAGAIPGYGAVVDIARMVNDTTSAASAVVEAGSLAAETASEIFINGTQAIKTAIQLINEKKKEAMNISDRTNEKIKQFQNPTSYVSNNTSSKGGGIKKSKKRFFKRNSKSKKVRFSA
jgi:hypothetical protein